MQDGVISFVIVGAKNSGKTVFLSTLFGQEDAFVSANKKTKEYLEANWKRLKKGKTPSATSGIIKRLDFQYKSREHTASFAIDDYDGYFVETLSDEDEHTQEDRNTLKKNIKKASGLLFLFPFERKHDEESLERFQYEIDTFIQLIREIYPNRKDLPIPTVIVIPKWDQSRYFKASDESRKVVEYIESVGEYKAASAKIKTFFADVAVMPVSSFGISIDGIHPVRGKITPHNLSQVFDYLLNAAFHKFEQKALALQGEGNIPQLFRFLSTIHDDIRFYKDGKLIRLYREAENQYVSEVIDKLKNASSPGEQENILNEHAFLYQNLRNKELNKKIDALLKKRKAKTKKRRSLKFLSFLLLAGLIAYGATAFKTYVEERNAFVAIQHLDPKSMPEEMARNCSEYLNRYKSKSLLLPLTDIPAHRDEVQRLLTSAEVEIINALGDRYEQLKMDEPGQKNLLQVRDLAAMAELFPDIELCQRIRAFAEEFEQTLKQGEQKVVSSVVNAAETLLSTGAEVSEIDEILARLNQMPDNETVSDLRERLLERKRDISTITNEAKALLSRDAGLSETEKILERLNLKEIPDNEMISDLRSQFQKRMQTLELQEAFDNLYNKVKVTSSLSDIPSIVSRQWRDNFSDDFAYSLKTLIQNKVAEKDQSNINDLRERFESVEEIRKQERKLAEIEGNVLEIPEISFRYYRDEDLEKRLKSAEDGVEQYRRISKKLYVGVTFGTKEEDNEPLDFSCGMLKGNEIILELDYYTFSYKNSNARCEQRANGSVMIWDIQKIPLTPRHLPVKATEKDAFSDDTVSGHIKIDANTLISIYNEREKEFYIPGTPYFIIFRRN